MQNVFISIMWHLCTQRKLRAGRTSVDKYNVLNRAHLIGDDGNMPNRNRVPTKSLYLGPELSALTDAHLAREGITLSTFVRRLIAVELGVPELADAVKMGRPWPGSPPEARLPQKRGRNVAR